MQDFAQEIVDEIIDNIGLNEAGIGTCGLVCKRWLRRSRFHLFSSITLFDQGSGRQNVDSFFHLLDTSSHPLLSFVKVLDLRFDEEPFDDAHMTSLHSCSKLINLRITVDGHAAHEVYRSLQIHIPLLGINSPSLSSLELQFSTDIPLSALTAIISAAPLLDFLYIWYLFAQIVHDGSPLPSCSLPHLKMLEIDGIHNSANPLFTWILSAPILPIFETLTLQTVINGVNDPTEVYLQRAGPEIEVLELEVYAATSDQDSARAFERRAVQYCCGLRHFTLKSDHRDTSDILTLLRTISSSQLATLRLALVLPQVECWNRIDAALSGPQFRALKSFAAEERGHPTGESEDNLFEIYPELKLHMPLANARGILGSEDQQSAYGTYYPRL
ncbi:hypothetical protein C8R44DRAFT_223022 [Mycena epipterygia]|nr:hypothetical protein C8R44DRAFT_223022 [Mycena epipterygia]